MNSILKKMFMTTFSVQIVSMLSGTINSIVDGIVIGRCLGIEEMTAYGYVTPIIMIVLALGILFGAGTSGSCGRVIGAGDKKEISSCFSSIFIAGIVIGFIGLLVLEVFSGSISAFLTGNTNQDTVKIMVHVKDFLIGYGFNMLPALLVVLLSPVMQFDGKPHLSVIAMLVMTVCNIILDVLNGLVIHWGMFGMAMATSISSMLAVIIMMTNVFRKEHLMKFSLKSFNLKYIKMLFSYGMTASIMIFAGTLTIFFLNRILGQNVGKDAVAALAAVNTASALCTTIGLALRITLVTLVSLFEGEKDEPSQYELMKLALKRGMLLNIIAMIVIITCSSLIMIMFLKSGTSAYEMSVTGIRLYASMMLFFSWNMILSGYYQGKRKIGISITIILLDKLICVCILSYVLVNFFGAMGVWMSFPLGSLAAMLLSFAIICILNRKLSYKLQNILSITDSDKTPDARFTIDDALDIVIVSDKISHFCYDNGADARSSYLLALAAEELANNIISYGFEPGRNNHISIRVTGQGQKWKLRIRDDCHLFDPEQYVKLFDYTQSPSEHIGIRMISGMASEFLYFNSMNMNQVVVNVGAYNV
jgi:Na+-driven multidrug efflux pump/anti-sigma regulatory factor (Ser/Thr protein kinase)